MGEAAAPRRQRPRNPERTARDILVAAREEFCEHGFEGARIDRIAARAAANKRLLYHYFGNKEARYSAVLLDAYREIRRARRRADPQRWQNDDLRIAGQPQRRGSHPC